MYMLYDMDVKFKIVKVKFKIGIYIKNLRIVLYEEIFLIGYVMRVLNNLIVLIDVKI